jgi:hypothetical protein
MILGESEKSRQDFESMAVALQEESYRRHKALKEREWEAQDMAAAIRAHERALKLKQAQVSACSLPRAAVS